MYKSECLYCLEHVEVYELNQKREGETKKKEKDNINLCQQNINFILIGCEGDLGYV